MNRMTAPAATGGIRVGIGGWSYAPWKETFYPDDLPQSRALEYASRQVTAIEINSTFYGTQKPATFAKWHAQTPDDFVFTVKAPRAATHRHDLDEAGGSIERFLDSGLDRLGDKLGPLLWQFAPTKPFAAEEFDRFLQRLPTTLRGRPLRHAMDVRHASFACADFIALARRHRVAVSCTDADDVPHIADATADFVYLRLREARSTVKTGYTLPALKKWATAVRAWREGALPASMKPIGEPAARQPREVFAYFINGAKERAPAAALALGALLGIDGQRQPDRAVDRK